MAGMFDDLIPAEPKAGAGGGMFDDLIPKAEDVTAGMALRGIPVLGAYVPQAEAAIRAAAQPLTGVGEPGASFSERYAANLPKRQAQYKMAEENQPLTSAALQLGGGAAALAPIGATALGARALGAAGPLVARVPAGIASGAALSAADAAARGEDVGSAAELGGALGGAVPVIGAAAGRLGRTARSYLGAPNADELGSVVDAGYTALRGSGLEIKPQAMRSAINQIRIDAEVHPKLTPNVSGLLDDAANKGIMSPLTAGRQAGVGFDDIDTLRKQLGKLARDYTNPPEQLAARDAVRGIDDYLTKISPADVIKGDARQVAALAAETRGNAAAEFRLRAMNALRQRAEDQAGSAASGMNVENAYRQQLRAFIRPNNKGISPALKEGFTPSEINQLRWATRGSSLPNMLRLVGNVLGGGHGIMAGAGLATAYQTGDPRYAAAVGAGYGARRLSNAMMRNRADMLGRMTAARSPLAGVMGTGGAVGLPANLGAGQASLMGLLPNLPGYAAGGRPPKDRPIMVGENGPEVFVPDRAGTVVPQRAMPYRPGEQMDNLMASVNGPQGYPDFHWVNPAGVDAFLASGPMSTNIEDRRDELGGFDAAAGRMRRQGRRP